MIEREFLADGKRRQFKFEGAPEHVYIRVGRTDRSQQQGIDYEVDGGGIVFARAPRHGVRVVVHTQPVPKSIREVVQEVVHVPAEPVVIERVVTVSAPTPPDQKLIRNSPELLTAPDKVAAPVVQLVPELGPALPPVPTNHRSDSLGAVIPVRRFPEPVEPETIDDIKAETVKALRDVAKAFGPGLTEENRAAWEDRLARLAVDVWKAPTHGEAVVARSRALQFIKEVTGQS